MFLFASLSFAKRHTKMAHADARGGTDVRGGEPVDLSLMFGIGMAMGTAG